MTKQFLIVRHAETTWNAPRKRIQGQCSSSEISVSAQGAQEARPKLAHLPKPNLLILSPLLRCKQTAELWFDAPLAEIPCDIVYEEGLKEIHMGKLEGLYMDDALQVPEYKEVLDSWKNNPGDFLGFPQGETLQDFQARVLAAFAKICQSYESSALSIAILTHLGPMRVLHCFMNHQEIAQFWNYNFTPAESFYLQQKDIIRLQLSSGK